MIAKIIGRFLPCTSLVGLLMAVLEAFRAHVAACDERVHVIREDIERLRAARDQQIADLEDAVELHLDERYTADRIANALERMLSE